MAQKSKGHFGMGMAFGAATAAAIAGAYFLYGKDGTQNRRKAKSWMLKMKAEVLEKIERIKELDEERYHAILDEVSARYAKLKTLDKSDVDAAVKELRSHWRSIKRHMGAAPKKKPARKTSSRK